MKRTGKRKKREVTINAMSETSVSKEDFTKSLGDFTRATELKPVAAKRTEAEAIDNQKNGNFNFPSNTITSNNIFL